MGKAMRPTSPAMKYQCRLSRYTNNTAFTQPSLSGSLVI